MTDDGPAWGRNVGVNRDPVVAANTPCQDEQEKYDDAVAAQRITQRDLDNVNSSKAEKAVKATKDKKRIAEWEAAVKKATKANNDDIEGPSEVQG